MNSSMYRGFRKWKSMHNSKGKVEHYNPRNGRKSDWSVADQRRHEVQPITRTPNPFK